MIFGSLNPFDINTFLTYIILSSSVDEVQMLGALCQNALFEKDIMDGFIKFFDNFWFIKSICD